VGACGEVRAGSRGASRIIRCIPGVAHFEVPRTMILLDPDLDTDAVPRPAAAKRTFAADTRNMSMPSVRTLARFLAEARQAACLGGQVSLLLTTDAGQRSLNRRFRGKNKPTDVLSFPSDPTLPGAKSIAGDLSISVPTARRQAAQQGHSLSTEIKVLILHGVLHLAGYDHETDSGEMALRERRLRTRLRLPGGLIERTHGAKLKPRSRPAAPKSAARGRRA
jgi:probable rRNA maturation factor